MPSPNAHAARVDDNNMVEEVIVIPYCNDNDADVTAYCNAIGLPGRWLDTSYIGARRGKYAGSLLGERMNLMNDPIPTGVVITLREVYDSIQRLDAKMTQLTEARGNYAGVGDTYDPVENIFKSINE